MKLYFIRKHEVETAFGSHHFNAGDLIAVDQTEDAHRLLLTGYTVPHNHPEILKKLSRISPEDIAMINEALIVFNGRIIDVKIPERFDMTQCNLKPSPYGECHSFDMKIDKTDLSLSPFCKRARKFCLHAESRKGGGDPMIAEKKKAVGKDGQR